ncbi:MAG: helix-turn-helix transcriptional regulator [Hamadaea sp.]|nr:helix-turn-helix transcriptional regulator [Hamadaea sp.]
MPKPSATRPRRAVISGHLIQLARVSAGITQERLAELLGASRNAVQGWESGRRPITAVGHGAVMALQHRLVALGARSDLVAALSPATEADLLLAALLDNPVDDEHHPLGWTVLRHGVVEMLLWALAGHPPRVAPSAPAAARRGPAAPRPELDPGEDAAAFDALRNLAERTAGRAEQLLTHRQAVFLASVDPSASPTEWTRPDPATREHFRRPIGWTPHWASARSLAVALARSGDPEPLAAFIRNADDAWELANLQYWAYWCGDLAERQADDQFMSGTRTPWRGSRLYAHLTTRLDPASSRTDLNIHTLWSLLQVQPGLPADDPAATARLLSQTEPLLDSGELSTRAVGELRSVRYALMMQGHTAKEQP